MQLNRSAVYWHGTVRRAASLAFSLLFLAGSVLGQTPDEHASHHPAAGSPTPPPAGTATASPPQPQAQGATVDAKPPMTGEPHGMGAMARKELYPSLMQLAETTPEQRAELEELARERMRAGAALMASSVERLNSAALEEDLESMSEAAERIREGVLQFETGTATLQALSRGSAPRDIALGWFRQNMGLLPSEDEKNPHGFFGLTAFHYFTMLIVAAVAGTLIWANFRKMRRAQALLARLAGTSVAAPGESPLAGGTDPEQLAPLLGADAPSRQNSWSGLLRVARIFEETPNVRTLRLVDIRGSELPFRHLPGQFVTFAVSPIDEVVRRSYTIASSPTRRDYCEVTIKREVQGTVSNFLHHVHEGDTLQVTGPSGNFTFIGEGANSIVLISGGVGITPMMSVLRFLTDRTWAGDIFFIYGCRGERDVIYREELEYLARRNPNLHLTIVADEVASAEWPHAKGTITQERLDKAIPHIQSRRIHLCGPPPMMAVMKTYLGALGVPPAQIKTEVFIGKERPARAGVAEGELAPAPAQPAAQPEVAVATFARSKRAALLPPDKTVLEAAEDVGVNIEYSCRVGVCGLCKVKLLSGAVTMEVQDGLDAQDKQNGMILACQAKSATDLSVDA